MNLGIFKQLRNFTKNNSTKSWLSSHKSDPYVKQAQKHNYRSRSAFKLLQIDEEHKFLKPNLKILELGSAPGGWTQILLQKSNSAIQHPNIVAIDLLEMKPLLGVKFIQGNFTNSKNIKQIQAHFSNKKIP